MSATLLKTLGTGAALLSLGGCAYVTPYPEAFPTRLSDGGAHPCVAATATPGSSPQILSCLRARGQAWDQRGVAIRRQAGFVGQMSIPLGIAGLGLSAADDTSDFVPISAGITSAALAHTGAYARPSQAEVYELATEAYRCLVSGVAEWNGAGRSVVNQAYDDFRTKSDAALTALRGADGAGLLAVTRRTMDNRLVSQAATARHTHGALDGAIGTALLRRSDEIDAAAIRAIRDRLPDPQAVAASVARSAPVAADTPDVGTAGLPAPGGGGGGAAVVDPLANLKRLVAEADQAAAAFDAAVKAYIPPSLTTACTFNPSSLPGLAATPAAVVLDASGVGRFVLRHGVPPYGNIPAPDGISVTLIPLNSSASSVEVKATAGANGPWTLQMMDSSSAGGVVEVQVRRP